MSDSETAPRPAVPVSAYAAAGVDIEAGDRAVDAPGQPADHRGEHKDGCSGHRWPRRPDIDPSDKPEPRMRRYATEWSSKPTEADELTDTNDRSKP